jgi:acetyl esterase/lipase
MLRIDPFNIAIGGASAGGHLAAILALRCHSIHIPLKLQLLNVPVVDLTLFNHDWTIPPNYPYKSYCQNAMAPGLPLERMQFFFKYLLGETKPYIVPIANPAILPPDVELSPIKAASFNGLPPAFIVTADVDILRDEAEEYARKLKGDGVRVRLKRFMGVPHPFALMDGTLQEARDYVTDCCEELRKAFDTPSNYLV